MSVPEHITKQWEAVEHEIAGLEAAKDREKERYMRARDYEMANMDYSTDIRLRHMNGDLARCLAIIDEQIAQFRTYIPPLTVWNEQLGCLERVNVTTDQPTSLLAQPPQRQAPR